MINLAIKVINSVSRHPLLWLAVLIGIALRLFFLYNTEGTAYTNNDHLKRLEQAVYWYHHPYTMPGTFIWLPAHHVLMALSFPFTNSLTGARWVTLILGVATIPLLYVYAYKLFNKQVAGITALMLAVNGMHVKYSTLTMSEVPFLFFLAGALCSLLLLRHHKSYGYAIVLVFCLNVINLLRYEAWVWSAAILFILFSFSALNYKRNLLIAISAFISVLWFGVLGKMQMGHPFHGLQANTYYLSGVYQNTSVWQYLKASMQYNDLFSWSMAIVVVPALLYAVIIRKQAIVLFTILAITLLFVVKILTGSLAPYWRFFLANYILLLPFMIYGIVRLMSVNRYVCYGVFLFMLSLSIVQVNDAYSLSLVLEKQPLGYKESAIWIKAHRQRYQKVLFDPTGADAANWTVRAGVLPGEAYTAYPATSARYIEDFREGFDQQVFNRIVFSGAYYYIACGKSGMVDSVIHSQQSADTLHALGATITTVFNSGNYKVYAISYNDTAYRESVMLYEQIADDFPANTKNAFSKFGIPGEKGNTGYMSLLAVACAKADKRLNSLSDTEGAELMAYLLNNFPGFVRSNPNGISSEILLSDLKVWAAKYPGEVKKAEAIYKAMYSNRQ